MSRIDEFKKEVVELVRLKPREDETAEDFTARVLKKVLDDKLTPAEKWNQLGASTQDWVNTQATIQDEMRAAEKAGKDYEGTQLDLFDPVMFGGKKPAEPSEEETAEEADNNEAGDDDTDADDASDADDGETQQETDVEAATETAGAKAGTKKAKKAAGAKKTAAPAKKAAAKKTIAKKAAPTKKANGAGRGRKATFTPDQKIKVLVKENPRREGTKSYKMFAKYKDGMTVAEAVKAGIGMVDLRWDAKFEHISVK
jgi:hypothetical protein